MGSWRNQTLSSLIDLLDDKFGFTCYWPGIHNSIWRITGCWLDHYDLHFWSNVACVNRNSKEGKGVAEQMEAMFYETLDKGDEYSMTWENRKKHRLWRQGKEYVEQRQGTNNNDSYHSVGQRSSNNVQDNERQFMITSKQLVDHHQSLSSPSAQTILNQHLPTPYQKIQYYKSLQRNIMFPESSESSSLTIIRYVHRVFGGLLARESGGDSLIHQTQKQK